jgi:uncharacterized Zn finger protein
MSWYYNYPRRETVAERKRKAQRNLQRLRKKHPDIRPIVIEGKGPAKTWWGKAWNANLERYADYSNRIGRGRSYVKNGFVLDLKITRGCVDSLVMGTRPQPYSVRIKIAGLTQQKWAAIKKKARDKIDSLQELLDGSFPRELEEIFTARGAGLFPSPQEIKLSCSCPDWAVMCKHVAAALYGAGARLDEDPGLFFTLRGVDVGDLVSTAVNRRRKELLGSVSGKKRSPRVIEGGDARLASLFNIDIAEAGKSEASVPTTRKKLKKGAKGTAKKTAHKKKLRKKS